MITGVPIDRDAGGGLVESLAKVVTVQLKTKDRILVGIDGPDTAGKTTLADDLAEFLGSVALRCSIDGFHNPKNVRLQRGELSPEGYYLDSFDYKSLKGNLWEPFTSGATSIRCKTFDYRTDSEVEGDYKSLTNKAVLVFDGVFLLRPELLDQWDISVYLQVSPEEILKRALLRDLELFGSESEIRRRYESRYLPGQAIYRSQANPEEHADILVDNTNPVTPIVMAWRFG